MRLLASFANNQPGLWQSNEPNNVFFGCESVELAA